MQEISFETLEKLKKELDELKKVKRKEIAEQLRQAISYGDLKENAAYHEAKESQAFLEGRIIELTQVIKNSVIVEKKKGNQKVVVGSKVTVLCGTDKQEYFIVGSRDADPLQNKISCDSPIGKSLLNCSEKDKVSIQAPSGEEIVFEILKIE